MKTILKTPILRITYVEEIMVFSFFFIILTELSCICNVSKYKVIDKNWMEREQE